MLDALRAAEMASCLEWCEALPASRTALERVHSARYLDGLERVAGQGGGVLDADTVMSGVGCALGAVLVGLSWRRYRRAIAELEQARRDMRAEVESLRELLRGKGLHN